MNNGTNQYYTLANNFDIGNNNHYFACVVNIPTQATLNVRVVLSKGIAPAPDFTINAFYNTGSVAAQGQYIYYPIINQYYGVLNGFTGLVTGWNILVYTVSSGFQSFFANFF